MITSHPADRTYRNTLVRLADLTVNTNMIENLHFENCMVMGPAVLLLLDGVELSHCDFSAPGGLDQLFWLIPPERTGVLGAAGIRDVKFYSCKFVDVGFAGPAELRDALFSGTVQD